MTPRDVDRFFFALARAWPHRTDCLLIGGAAAVLEGGSRPTDDIDFEVKFGGGGHPEDVDAFAGAVKIAEAASGFGGQFSTDIERWSRIAMPPYRASARPWKRFGPITVRLLHPTLYIVSKLRRGTAEDFTDLLLVIRHHHTRWEVLAKTCAVAVKTSPLSTALGSFIKRVEFLFRHHGRDLWGARFDPEAATASFHAAYRGRKRMTSR